MTSQAIDDDVSMQSRDLMIVTRAREKWYLIRWVYIDIDFIHGDIHVQSYKKLLIV